MIPSMGRISRDSIPKQSRESSWMRTLHGSLGSSKDVQKVLTFISCIKEMRTRMMISVLQMVLYVLIPITRILIRKTVKKRLIP